MAFRQRKTATSGLGDDSSSFSSTTALPPTYNLPATDPNNPYGSSKLPYGSSPSYFNPEDDSTSKFDREGGDSAGGSSKDREITAVEDRREARASRIVCAVLTILALVVRFWGINYPDQVVFDEVHFGAFAGQYIRREYYFDVHPPLTKMLIALAGYLTGFDGHFNFDNIGDSYTTNKVAYQGMRKFCALLGGLTVPVIYAIMRESGYPVLIAAFSACLVLFGELFNYFLPFRMTSAEKLNPPPPFSSPLNADNAHVTQSRLILLDAAFIFFISLSIHSYIKFYQYRYLPFTTRWWFWMCSTGFWLACVLGSKMGGQLIFLAIGSAVVWDLWNILDVKRGHTMVSH